MTVSTEVKKAFKSLGLTKTAKEVKKETLTTKSVATTIKDNGLDVLSSLSVDELKEDFDNFVSTFKENLILPIKDQTITLTLGQDELNPVLIKKQLSGLLLKEEKVTSSNDSLWNYLDLDTFFSEKLKAKELGLLAVYQDNQILLVIYQTPKELPTYGQIKKLLALQEKEDPTPENQEQYQKLYNLIKGQYESNKGYFLNREEQEQKRILYDDNARDFVKLASILRVGF